jgi:hypothetical protein
MFKQRRWIDRMMKKLIFLGLIVLVSSALFIWDSLSEYWHSGLTGEILSFEDFVIPLILGSIGVFIGIGLVVLGFLKSRK